MDHRDIETEQGLDLDLMVYGSCYWKVVDGRKVRIDPRTVYIKDGESGEIER